MSEQQNNQQNNTKQQSSQSKTSQGGEHKNSKVLRIAGSIVLLVIIIALFINARSKKVEKTASEETVVTTSAEGCKPGDLFSETTGKPCPQPEQMTSDDVVDSDYESTVMEYRGKSITVTGACVGLPAQATFAVGTRVLLNNISSEKVTLSLGDKVVTLSPYHYATTIMKTAGTFTAKCNDKAVATVVIK